MATFRPSSLIPGPVVRDVYRLRELHDFDAGIRHVRENPAPYVIKPLGELQNVKRLLYVGNEDDGGDVVDVLTAYRKAWGHRMKGFQLQRKVEGVEVAICGFFDGDGDQLQAWGYLGPQTRS